MAMRIIASICLAQSAANCDIASVTDLSHHYGEVFKTGNRNAASHLWASFIVERSVDCDGDTLETLFRGFCPISGSPLPDDPHTQYSVTLKKVGGGEIAGISHHCCWPCICDMQESVWVDTMIVNTSKGPQRWNALVIGDPCATQTDALQLSQKYVDPFSGHEESLAQSAPEVKCDAGRLLGATFSEKGYPVIGIFFDKSSVAPGTVPSSSDAFRGQCEQRKDEGYNSGMGLIFHKVAAINPISLTSAPLDLQAKFVEAAYAGGSPQHFGAAFAAALAMLAGIALVMRVVVSHVRLSEVEMVALPYE